MLLVETRQKLCLAESRPVAAGWQHEIALSLVTVCIFLASAPSREIGRYLEVGYQEHSGRALAYPFFFHPLLLERPKAHGFAFFSLLFLSDGGPKRQEITPRLS